MAFQNHLISEILLFGYIKDWSDDFFQFSSYPFIQSEWFFPWNGQVELFCYSFNIHLVHMGKDPWENLESTESESDINLDFT